MGNNIYGVVASSKVFLVLAIWFIYYRNGSKLSSYYWWTWFSAVLAVVFPWGPVSFAWILLQTSPSRFAETLFFYSSLVSIIGPMVGYFAPLVILVLAYNERKDTGLQYASRTHFWLGWWLAVNMTLLSIFFEFAFLPGIRVWYELKTNPELFTEDTEEETVVEEDGPIIISEE